jgi:heme exporter protein A
MKPRLTVHDLACRRGDRLLFRGISFEIEAGRALHVRGANGTGKSSLLRILAGLLRPFAGAVERSGPVALLDGRLPLDEHLPLARSLGFWERIDGVDEALDPALNSLFDVPVRFLSTGQRKRAAIAQSHPHKRGIWLLDEPLNGLDTRAAANLQVQVAEHCRAGGIAVIASHQPFELAGLKQIDLTEYAA